jgi:SAM-dependent methyltransferase
VLAIDLDTDLLHNVDEPNVEVVSADVLELSLPPGSLDLIHTRAVLTHIPERARAIDRMVRWLAPGGWLVLEEIDWLGQVTSDPSWSAGMHAYDQATVTIDWRCGRELVSELTARGLDSVDAGAKIDTIRGATPLADWYELSMRALRAAVLAADTATNAEIDVQLARLQDPTFRALGFTWIGAWGRR